MGCNNVYSILQRVITADKFIKMHTVQSCGLLWNVTLSVKCCHSILCLQCVSHW